MYVLKNKKAIKTRIEAGLEGNDYYEVLSGIDEGDIVAVGPNILDLTDGSNISTIQTK